MNITVRDYRQKSFIISDFNMLEIVKFKFNQLASPNVISNQL